MAREPALCCAGGYWALPLQWLTISIVNNEFLDGEGLCMLRECCNNHRGPKQEGKQ